MKYKVWFWICLSISIVFILITIGIHTSNKNANEKAFLEYLAQYEEEVRMMNDSIKCLSSYNDSIIKNQLRSEYDERIRIEVEKHKEEELNHSNHPGMGTEPHSLYEDTIRIREEMEMKYRAELVRQQEEIERLSQQQKEKNEQILKEKTDEIQDSNFAKASGAASILGLFFTFFFRYKDNKEKRKENEVSGNNRNVGINLANIPFSFPTQAKCHTQKPAEHQRVFEFRTKYFGYMTTIIYNYRGKSEVKNVSVSVEQKADEMVSLTLIKNNDIFQIEKLYVGDSFEIEVECYYKKAYRYFSVEWEDETGKHTQRNHVLLSKDYEA